MVFSRLPSERKLTPAYVMDVIKYGDTELMLEVTIDKYSRPNNPFSSRENSFKIKIFNGGEKPVDNLFIEAFTPQNVEFSNPGELFGGTRRHVRVPALSPKKSITYKLNIRVLDQFEGGRLRIFLSSATMESHKLQSELSVVLTLRK